MSHQSGSPGVVDLQYKPGVDHRPVFLVQGIRQGEQKFFLGPVVFVEDEVVEPAGREHGHKRFLDIGARTSDRRLEGVELAVDGLAPL
jgi:hypothetical protein